MQKKILATFPAFTERNFRLYFGGQFISLCGTWLQTVALGWLVLQITGSAFWVGTVSALTVLPTLVFSLAGGVIVDRFDKKHILYFTQACAMIIALSIGVLTLTHLITLLEVCLLAVALGTVNAVDIPALQAFVSEMVGREHLASALALNSALQNAARTIGPAIAGALVAFFGVGWAFILNGLSFIAVLIAFCIMVIRQNTTRPSEKHPLQMIKGGLSYTFSHTGIALFMYTFFVMAMFGYSYVAMLPVIAQNVFASGASGFGYMLAAIGFGALFAALIVSAYSKRISPRLAMIGSNTIFGIGLLVFSLTRNFPLAIALLIFTGFAFTFESSMANTIVQHEVEPVMRGRVMSILIMMFFGAAFLGNFLIGYFVNTFGVMTIIGANSLVMLAWSTVLYRKRRMILGIREV